MRKSILLAIAFFIMFILAVLFLYLQSDSFKYGDEISQRLETCARIDPDMVEGRAYCFTSVAIEANDQSICGRIPVYQRTSGTYAIAKSSCEKQVLESANESSGQ